MKTKFLIIATILLTFITCKDEDPQIHVGSGNQIVIEQTQDSVSYWDAIFNGTISNLQKRSISEYGHCWDTLPNSILAKNKTIYKNTQADVEYKSTITNLLPNNDYYVRSYFVLGTDTAYSTENLFTTKAIQKPIVIKSAEPNTDLYTAILYGKITDNGGEILTKGFYYGSSAGISQSDTLILNTSESLTFYDTLNNLKPNSTYYAKIFATNRAGIGFSNEFQFTTKTKIAELTTINPTDILPYSCKTGGNITNDFCSEITQRGVCYSANPSPTINDSLTLNGTGSGTFESEITELQPNTNYYVRAYARNEKGVAYGNELSFKTGVLAQITTNVVSQITANSAISGGKISSSGDSEIISQGICYSIAENPTIANSKIIAQLGQNNFTCSLPDLELNTTYYIKAFAENNSGIAYGNQKSFITKTGIPVIQLDSMNTITAIAANIFATITNDGGLEIISKGFCWSINSMPTIDDNTLENNSETLNLHNTITDLSPASNYYIRVYVTNQLGTYYSSNQYSFSTPDAFPYVMTGNLINLSFNTASFESTVIDDYGYSVTERGVCFSENLNPTIDNEKIINGDGLGSFTSAIQNIQANTTFYIRAYAISSKGIGYGNSKTFTTTNFIQKTLGGSDEDYAYSVCATNDGGCIIGGRVWSDDGDVSDNDGGHEAWIVKLNSDFEIEWKKTYGGTNGETLKSIRQMPDGGYIVAASSLSNDGDVSINTGNSFLYDFWIIKLSSSGDIVWEKSYGGSSADYSNDIILTSDGGYLAVGATHSVDGDVTGNYGGKRDAWVIKLNTTGELDWQYSLGGSDDERAYAAIQTSDNGFLITSEASSNDGEVSSNLSTGAWLVKLDENGTLIWEKSYSNLGLNFNALIEDNNGNIFLSGSVNDNGCLANISSTGSLIWYKEYGGSLTDGLYKIIKTSDGNYVLAGHSTSNDNDLNINYGSSDFWIIKTDNAGELIWSNSIGGLGAENALSVAQDSYGYIIVAGVSNSVSGNVQNNHGGADYWVVKLTDGGDLIGE
ncbi:MAG: hypothetical protein IMY72_00645 [Bacteroidetes bacterium]|nr:hypothetical protein [Bacteroidota bacterium]